MASETADRSGESQITGVNDIPMWRTTVRQCWSINSPVVGWECSWHFYRYHCPTIPCDWGLSALALCDRSTWEANLKRRRKKRGWGRHPYPAEGFLSSLTRAWKPNLSLW